MKIKPVIMAGGVGARLWPLSRQLYPKQFIKIFDGLSLLQRTLLRNQVFGKPTIIVGENHRFIAAEQVQEINIEADIITEPSSKNTAPCAIIAALTAKQAGYDMVMLLPSDHWISSEEDYISVIRKSLEYVSTLGICIIGIKPESSNIGYGYIKAKNQIDANIFTVEKFVEKPNLDTALAYFAMTTLGHGSYFWNSGIFIFKVDFLLKEAQKHQLILFEQVYNSFVSSIEDKDFIRLNKDYYDLIKPISVDYAIIEHLDQMIMVRAEFLWKDMGSWYSLWRSRAKDECNNYFEGDVFARSVTNSYISTGKKLTAVIGLDNVIVINTEDGVLVANKSKVDDISELVAHLDDLGRVEVIGYTSQLLSRHLTQNICDLKHKLKRKKSRKS
ncbi:Mannose-1-phosphate guanylyltransferase RfbM [Candidatus Trichorickettsia mobilis]|uniref:Mannose-1-phosphate guanylyltransferase RfbM n=1 Tax=Candidatus Trichorickettsia mobilis TaxID=1346319 RepID=A0ABZ0UTS3_9RICK|nr:mannose-1-phosphate guanylyltransferase [Candidatus Trichorickettsia mobilis]WPY01048.1 Mannose-1-phosphate guanylyltransferase RfbM [Candidatus Trichorickettsia mobilis]